MLQWLLVVVVAVARVVTVDTGALFVRGSVSDVLFGCLRNLIGCTSSSSDSSSSSSSRHSNSSSSDLLLTTYG